MLNFQLKKKDLYFFTFAKPYWKQGIFAISVMIWGNIVALAAPYIWKIIIDDIIPNKDTDMLFNLIILMGALAIIERVISFAADYIYAWVGNNIVIDLRGVLYNRLLWMPINFYDQYKIGDILDRISADIGIVRNFIITIMLNILNNILRLISLVTILCVLDVKLFLLCSLTLIIYFIGLIFFSERVRILTKKLRKKQAEILNFVVERFSNVQLINIQNTHKYEWAKFQDIEKSLFKINMKGQIYSSCLSSTSGFAMSLVGGFLIGWGSFQIIEGNYTLGILTAFMTYFMGLFGPINQLYNVYFAFVKVSVSMERLWEIIDQPTQFELNEAAHTSFSFKQSISFCDVNFSYGDQKVLTNLNLELIKGKKYALIGRNGCGKTSLVHLLCNFYQPNSGKITIDGENKDLQGIDLVDMRKRIALVTQNNQIFDDTVVENIRYGNWDINESQIEAIARKVGLEDYVDPDSPLYNVQAGPGGSQFSGGQQQRIAIGRVMLKEADILIFDEATSALDAPSETALLRELLNSYSDKTMIFICHQLNVIKDVDEIICMDEGRIVERGSHKELFHKRGKYWRMLRDSEGRE